MLQSRRYFLALEPERIKTLKKNSSLFAEALK